MNEKLVRDYERLEDLQCKGLKLIQNPEWFCFGIDAVLLANFCRIKKGSKVVDLGTGTGVIPILLSAKTNASEIIGIEIQEKVADMAKRSVEFNKLEHKIKIITEDLKNASRILKPYSFDVVLSNPPYMKEGSSLINIEDEKAISRHEIKVSLEDVLKTSYELLKDNGDFYMIHRPHRLVDIIYLCRKYRLEPKNIRFIHPNKNKKPNIFIIHCTKYGKPELKFMDPLYVYNEKGEYTEEIYEIYGKEKL